MIPNELNITKELILLDCVELYLLYVCVLSFNHAATLLSGLIFKSLRSAIFFHTAYFY